MLRSPTNQLSIKPKMSTRTRVGLSLLILVLLVSVMALSFQFGMKVGNDRIEQDSATITRLETDLASLQDQLDRSQQDLIIAQRNQQIQEEAYEQMNQAYASSERKNSYLGSRLDFYRSIISPEDGEAGPAIQAFQASRNASGIGFKVTLVQAIEHNQQVMGNLQVSLIEGEQQIAVWPKSGPRSINYQYFEQISGVLEVAEFNQDARISVQFSLQNGEQLQREFNLSGLLPTL